jgi:hypothetical protein
VVKSLEAALVGEPPGQRAAAMHYYLGVAFAKTELEKAASHLQEAIAGGVDQEDVRFQLASVLDRSGAYAQARTEYDRFATAHPQSQLAVFALRRSATLSRFATTPGAPTPPGAVPPAAVAPPRPWKPAVKLAPPARATPKPAGDAAAKPDPDGEASSANP